MRYGSDPIAGFHRQLAFVIYYTSDFQHLREKERTIEDAIRALPTVILLRSSLEIF